MANLKISDTDIPSSSRSLSMDSSPVYVCTNTQGLFDRFLKEMKHSDLTRSVIDRTQSAFLDIPNSICDITRKCTGYFLTLGFRFLPGQSSFLTKSLSLPKAVESLIDFRNQLGLSLSKDSLTNMVQIKYNSLTDQASTISSRILVEAITYNNGYYGRFLVLVQLGIGCTVWYGFLPGAESCIPVDGFLFNPIDSYDSFINQPATHVQPGFDKITLVENEVNILPKLAEAYTHEKPFIDIQIPNAGGSLLMSVSLGLSVVILLSLGIAPNVDGIIT